MAGWFTDPASGKPVYQDAAGLVHVVNSTGKVEAVKPEELGKRLAHGEFDTGYTPATADDINEHLRTQRVEREGLAGHIKTAAEAAAVGGIDAVTAIPRVAARALLPEQTANDLETKALGGRAVLSNLAAIGGELLPGDQTGEAVARQYDEASRQRAQDRPGTALGGRIAGEVLSTLAMPGGGLTGAAEHGAAAAGLGAAGRAATRVAAMGAEAGAAGTVQATEDAWVGNTQLTGEAAASGAMKGLLLGAATGGALSGAGALARKVFGKPATSTAVTKVADEELGHMVEGVVGAPAEPGALAWLRRKASSLGKTVEEQQLRMRTPEEQGLIAEHGAFSPPSAKRSNVDEILHDYEGELNTGTTELQEQLNKAAKAGDEVREVWDNAPLKEEAIRPKITTNHDDAVQSAHEFALKMKGDAEAIMDQVGDATNKRVNRGLRAELQRSVDTIEAMGDNGIDAAKALTSVYQMKQAIQRAKKFYANSAPAAADAVRATRLAEQGFDAIQNDARAFTENTQIWGKAGDAVKEINAAYHPWLDKAAIYNETVMKNTGATFSGPRWEAWDEKIRPFLEKMGTGQAAQREAYVRDYVAGLRDLSDTIGKHFDVSPGAMAAVKKETTGALETIDRMKSGIGTANQLRAMAAAERGGHGGGFAGAAMGALVGGEAAPASLASAIVNRALGGSGGTALGPGTMALQAANLRAVAAKTVSRAESLTSDLVKPVVKAPRPINTVAIQKAARGALPAAVSSITAESSETRYRKVAERLVALQSEPQLLQDAVADHMGHHMPNFPQTSAAMVATSARAVSFLTSKLPAPLQQGGGLTPMRPSTVADSERSRFMRYVDAVEDPIGILQKIGDGTITDEHVEAIRGVYPEIFGAMQQAVSAAMVSGKANAPYQIRIRLEKLFDAPVDPTMAPLFAQFIQSHPEQQASQSAPRRSAGKSPNVAGSLSLGSPQTLHL